MTYDVSKHLQTPRDFALNRKAATIAPHIAPPARRAKLKLEICKLERYAKAKVYQVENVMRIAEREIAEGTLTDDDVEIMKFITHRSVIRNLEDGSEA